MHWQCLWQQQRLVRPSLAASDSIFIKAFWCHDFLLCSEVALNWKTVFSWNPDLLSKSSLFINIDSYTYICIHVYIQLLNDIVNWKINIALKYINKYWSGSIVLCNVQLLNDIFKCKINIALKYICLTFLKRKLYVYNLQGIPWSFFIFFAT